MNSKRRSRAGISEITSALIMAAAVISIGGTVTAQFLNQTALAQNSVFTNDQVQQKSVGELISLIYTAVNPSSQLVIEVYSYGASEFRPQAVYVDSGSVTYSLKDASTGSTVSYIAPSSRTDIVITSPSFSSAIGHSVYLLDIFGNSIQLST